MEISPKQTEDAQWVLMTDAEADSFSQTKAAIAEQYPGWQFGEWAEWMGSPLKGSVVQFPALEVAA